VELPGTGRELARDRHSVPVALVFLLLWLIVYPFA